VFEGISRQCIVSLYRFSVSVFRVGLGQKCAVWEA
jgi:hypothetical protein